MEKFQDKICPHCHTEFKHVNVRSFANHVRWCKENPEHEKLCGNIFKQKIAENNHNHAINKHGQIKTFQVECCVCKTVFEVQEREKDFPLKDRYFCSQFCAHSYSGKCADSDNISNGRKRFDSEHPGYWSKDHIPTVKETRKCKWCQTPFETTDRKNKKCCSSSCAAKYRAFKDFEKKTKCRNQ